MDGAAPLPPLVVAGLVATVAAVAIALGLRKGSAAAKARAEEAAKRAEGARAFLAELASSSFRREKSSDDEPLFAATRRGRAVLVTGPRADGQTSLEVTCKTLPLEAGDRVGRMPDGRAQEDFALASPTGHAAAVGAGGQWVWWNERGRAKPRVSAAPKAWTAWLDERADLLDAFPDLVFLPGVIRVSVHPPTLASLNAAVDALCGAAEESEART